MHEIPFVGTISLETRYLEVFSLLFLVIVSELRIHIGLLDSLELIFIQNKGEGSNYVFSHVDNIGFPVPLADQTIFSPMYIFGIF